MNSCEWCGKELVGNQRKYCKTSHGIMVSQQKHPDTTRKAYVKYRLKKNPNYTPRRRIDFIKTSLAGHKTCVRCLETKTIEQFYADKRNKDGRASYCAQCQNKIGSNSHGRTQRLQLQKAVRKGLIIRPDSCEICGLECKPDGHHFDYNKPLEVIWLCKSCHQARHKEAGRSVVH